MSALNGQSGQTRTLHIDIGNVRIPLTDDLIDAIAIRVAEILEAPEQSRVDDWLDAARAAVYLSCPKSRIYDLVQLGKLDPERDGRRLLFRRSDLDAYVIRRNGRERSS